jgi:hypothetical protein
LNLAKTSLFDVNHSFSDGSKSDLHCLTHSNGQLAHTFQRFTSANGRFTPPNHGLTISHQRLTHSNGHLTQAFLAVVSSHMEFSFSNPQLTITCGRIAVAFP